MEWSISKVSATCTSTYLLFHASLDANICVAHLLRFADAGAFDDDVVESTLGHQRADFTQKILTKSTTDATVLQLDKLFFRLQRATILVPESIRAKGEDYTQRRGWTVL